MGVERRRHVRVAGPFDGHRIGLLDMPVRIADLSEGGCFVESQHGEPEPGRELVLKIQLPEEGQVCVKAKALYAKPGFGFATVFVEVPEEAAVRLRRQLLRLRGLSTDEAPDRSTVATAAEAPEEATHRGSAKQILIADDDPGVLQLLRRALSQYQVLPARDVAEAWTLGRATSVDLLITDYLMPDGTGEELIRRLRQRQPSLKALILTGHGDMLDAESPGWWRQERHLSKPCSLSALHSAVTELIGPP
jgi:CheY-like chemotaxis protein